MDIEVAIDKLAQLETADDVADFLHGQGIRGYRCGAVTCPLARWLERETGLHVAVFEQWIKARDPFGEDADPWDPTNDRWCDQWGDQWGFPIPEALRAFVVAFDEREAYEMLVDPAPGDRHRCAHGEGW